MQMDDDPQPRLAILGAGPIGLEAALYARYLGYPVELLERSEIAAPGVSAKGSEQLSRPFAECASRLGVAALRAQNPDWQLPAASARLTATELYERYLKPLAESDLIAEVLRLGSEVVGIARSDDDNLFQVGSRNSEREEIIHEAEIVIDATGSGGNSTWFPEADANIEADLNFLNPAADVYILGSKSHPDVPFPFVAGLAQIRELFAILGEREDLDIYATMPPLA